MNTGRLLLGGAFLALIAGLATASLAHGGWFNRPKEHAYAQTPLNELSVKLGFVPDKDTLIPIGGFGLMVTGAVGLVLGWATRGAGRGAK